MRRGLSGSPPNGISLRTDFLAQWVGVFRGSVARKFSYRADPDLLRDQTPTDPDKTPTRPQGDPTLRKNLSINIAQSLPPARSAHSHCPPREARINIAQSSREARKSKTSREAGLNIALILARHFKFMFQIISLCLQY